METFARVSINECCSDRFSRLSRCFAWVDLRMMGWKVDLVVAKATTGEAWGWERILTGIFWCSLMCTWTGPEIGVLKKFSLYFTVRKNIFKQKSIEYPLKKWPFLKWWFVLCQKKLAFGQKLALSKTLSHNFLHKFEGFWSLICAQNEPSL